MRCKSGIHLANKFNRSLNIYVSSDCTEFFIEVKILIAFDTERSQISPVVLVTGGRLVELVRHEALISALLQNFLLVVPVMKKRKSHRIWLLFEISQMSQWPNNLCYKSSKTTFISKIQKIPINICWLTNFQAAGLWRCPLPLLPTSRHIQYWYPKHFWHS